MPAPGLGATRVFPPPPGKVFFGVSDTGHAVDFRSFEDAVGRHPAIVETYHPYGNNLHIALPRWKALRARPILHIGTVDEAGNEVVTPRAIATGKADGYLLRLNQSFANHHIRGYVRPLGEPNRCLNAWAAYDCAGASRGSRYSPRNYRRAFRRMYLLLHGGASRRKINGRLDRLGMPPIRRSGGKEPRRLPKAPIAVIWSPLPAGSPADRQNRPGHFYPGADWVDWVGTDFYSSYPFWGDLKRFYSKFAQRFDKPFALTEFGIQGADRPTFIRRLFGFADNHPHTRMLVYYQDFGQSNEYRIQNYPSSEAALSDEIRSHHFPTHAPHPPKP